MSDAAPETNSMPDRVRLDHDYHGWTDQVVGWADGNEAQGIDEWPLYVRADLTTPDTRDALIKELVRVKPLVFNQRASGWWAMSPFGFYVVAPTKTDNGDQWGIWYPETDIEDDPDGYASNEGAAMAVSQHAYERRVLSAVEAVPASQIRAEALREALAAAIRVIKYGKQSRRDSIVFDVEEAILALIDAPKVTQ